MTAACFGCSCHDVLIIFKHTFYAIKVVSDSHAIYNLRVKVQRMTDCAIHTIYFSERLIEQLGHFIKDFYIPTDAQ